MRVSVLVVTKDGKPRHSQDVKVDTSQIEGVLKAIDTLVDAGFKIGYKVVSDDNWTRKGNQ